MVCVLLYNQHPRCCSFLHQRSDDDTHKVRGLLFIALAYFQVFEPMLLHDLMNMLVLT